MTVLICGAAACLILEVLAVVAVNRRRARNRLPLKASAPGLRRIAVEHSAPEGTVFTKEALGVLTGTTGAFMTSSGVTRATVVAARMAAEGRGAVLVLEADAQGLSQVIQDALPHARVTLPEP